MYGPKSGDCFEGIVFFSFEIEIGLVVGAVFKISGPVSRSHKLRSRFEMEPYYCKASDNEARSRYYERC